MSFQEADNGHLGHHKRVMKLSIVHDIAEAIAGDITPSDGLSKEQKYKAELV